MPWQYLPCIDGVAAFHIQELLVGASLSQIERRQRILRFICVIPYIRKLVENVTQLVLGFDACQQFFGPGGDTLSRSRCQELVSLFPHPVPVVEFF